MGIRVFSIIECVTRDTRRARRKGAPQRPRLRNDRTTQPKRPPGERCRLSRPQRARAELKPQGRRKRRSGTLRPDYFGDCRTKGARRGWITLKGTKPQERRRIDDGRKGIAIRPVVTRSRPQFPQLADWFGAGGRSRTRDIEAQADMRDAKA
jgi:hypothetical protein